MIPLSGSPLHMYHAQQAPVPRIAASSPTAAMRLAAVERCDGRSPALRQPLLPSAICGQAMAPTSVAHGPAVGTTAAAPVARNSSGTCLSVPKTMTNSPPRSLRSTITQSLPESCPQLRACKSGKDLGTLTPPPQTASGPAQNTQSACVGIASGGGTGGSSTPSGLRAIAAGGGSSGDMAATPEGEGVTIQSVTSPTGGARCGLSVGSNGLQGLSRASLVGDAGSGGGGGSWSVADGASFSGAKVPCGSFPPKTRPSLPPEMRSASLLGLGATSGNANVATRGRVNCPGSPVPGPGRLPMSPLRDTPANGAKGHEVCPDGGSGSECESEEGVTSRPFAAVAPPDLSKLLSPDARAGEPFLTRTLRAREDEIVRLKEQVRIVSRAHAWSPPSPDSDASNRRLVDENAKLCREIASLKASAATLVGSGEALTTTSSAQGCNQPDFPFGPQVFMELSRQVAEFQRQLNDQDEKRRSLEASLAEARATAERFEVENKSLLLKLSKRGATDPYQVLVNQREKQRLHEENRQLRQERDQWRQEREMFLAEQRRRDNLEEQLKKQIASLQERLDRTLNAGEVIASEPSYSLDLAPRTRGRGSSGIVGLQPGRGRGIRRNSGFSVPGQATPARRSSSAKLVRVGSQTPQAVLGTSTAAATLNRSASGSAVCAGRITPTVPALKLGGCSAGQASGGPLGNMANAVSDGCGTNGASNYSSTESSDDDSSTGSSSFTCETRVAGKTSLCAVFGETPLRYVANIGWYFRLRINAGCSDWVGGFAIGVTMSLPSRLVPLPDKAAKVPKSWLVGCWGRTFSNGIERQCGWSPQTLRQGDEVGFLVTLKGECVLSVNDVERWRFADPLIPVARDIELFPVADVSAAPMAVTFLAGAVPSPSTVTVAPRSTAVAPVGGTMGSRPTNDNCAAKMQDTSKVVSAASGAQFSGPSFVWRSDASTSAGVPPLGQLRDGSNGPCSMSHGGDSVVCSRSASAPALSNTLGTGGPVLVTSAAVRRVPPLALPLAMPQ